MKTILPIALLSSEPASARECLPTPVFRNSRPEPRQTPATSKETAAGPIAASSAASARRAKAENRRSGACECRGSETQCSGDCAHAESSSLAGFCERLLLESSEPVLLQQQPLSSRGIPSRRLPSPSPRCHVASRRGHPRGSGSPARRGSRSKAGRPMTARTAANANQRRVSDQVR